MTKWLGSDTVDGHRWIFLASILWGIVIAGCNSNPTSPSSKDSILPLSIGNHWRYAIYSVGLPNSTDSVEQRITEEMDAGIHGRVFGEVAVRLSEPESQMAPVTWLYDDDEDGLHAYGGIIDSDTLLTDFLYLKYPAKTGETWTVPILEYSWKERSFLMPDSSILYTCVATNSKFETPAGTFFCYVYHWKEKPEEDVQDYWEHFRYFAPRVGMVGEVIKSSLVDSVIYRIVLYDFEVAGLSSN